MYMLHRLAARVRVAQVRVAPAPWAMLLTIACACLGRSAWAVAAGGGKLMPDDNGHIAVQAFVSSSIYSALQAGGVIYVGRVTAHTANSPTNAMIEFGKLTLEVSETLRGKSVARVVLPYSRAARFVKSDYFQIWPDEALLHPGTVVCAVVIPGSYDRAAPALPLGAGAASCVFVVKGPVNQALAWLSRITDLQKLIDGHHSKKAFAAVTDAALDADERVRAYAVDALVGEFMQTAPSAIVDILRGQLAHANKLGLIRSGEAQHVMVLLRQTARDEHASPDARRAAVRGLAMVVKDNDNPAIRSLAILSFAAAVAENGFSTPTLTVTRGPGSLPLPFKAADNLSADEIAAITRVLNAQGDDKQVAEAVRVARQWLDRR